MWLQEADPVASKILARLELSKPNDRRMALVILANFKKDPNATVFYPRDRNFYSLLSTRRYRPNYYTCRATLSAVDALSRAGFIEDTRTPPSPRATMRSRLKASSRLVALLTNVPDRAIQYGEDEVIGLRRTGKSKQLIRYDETDEIRAMRADVHAQNEALRHVVVGLDGVEGIITVGGRRYDLNAKLFYRVFNGDFQHGGRWYGPAWQSMPEELRKLITLDGSPTYEHDYRSCHPRLLCANAGLNFPFEDPSFDFYRLPGFEREHVKAATTILLNAPSLRSARGALVKELAKADIADPVSLAKTLCKAVPAARRELKPYWGTGIGLRLQRIDSDICARVQAELRAQSIPVLSIHDSFIVPVAARRLLKLIMETAMQDTCGHLRAHPLESAAL
jgi:hypothetical protein